LNKVCLTVDLDEESTNKTILQYKDGCFGEELGALKYVKAYPNATYNLSQSSIELRYIYDPFTSVAGED
jgi:hypothetical protein